MFKNFKIKNKKSSAGVTLVEIAVVTFIIVLFSLIVISDFPKIKRQLALSRVTYKLAQDLRKTEDLGLSGVQIKDASGAIIEAKGYGIYINLNQSPTQYIIYADVIPGNKKYDGIFSTPLCSKAVTTPTSDCPIEIIDISKESSSLSIMSPIGNVSGNITSINFSPPNPVVNIENLSVGKSQVEIVLGLSTDNSATRKVVVNTSGLVDIK